MNINYSYRVLSLPFDCVMQKLQTVTAEQLKVLIYACANDHFIEAPEKNRARAVKDLHMQWSDIEDSINFWKAEGVFVQAERTVEPVIKKAKSSELLKKEAPEYTSEEAASIIEKSDELKVLIDRCGAMLGKMLNRSEISHIVSMYEYLQLSPDYIALLFEHCIECDKKSVLYISRMAFSMFDSDITTQEALQSYIEEEKQKTDLIYNIKELFGIGARALTTKEKTCINRWVDEYRMPFDMIQEAYEITVNKTNEASVVYANAVLKRWHSEGYTTLEQTRAEAESYKASKKAKEEKKKMGNFDEDEFMALALQRSYNNKQ